MTLSAPPNIVQFFMDQTGITYPVFIVGEDVLDEYYAGERVRVPFNVFLGRDGKVAKKEKGYDSRLKKEMEEEVARLLKE